MLDTQQKKVFKGPSLSRSKFTASKVVREGMMVDPNTTRRRLMAAAKTLVQGNDHQDMLSELQQLNTQGHMSS